MSSCNKARLDAGLQWALEGLSNSGHDARVTAAKGRHTVKDRPFTETMELVAGFWIVQVKSRADALDWAKRMPSIERATVEVRRVAEFADFKGMMPPEAVAQEKMVRDSLAKRRA